MTLAVHSMKPMKEKPMRTPPPRPFGNDPYWIVISDLHSKTARLSEIPGLAEAVGVIILGDITSQGSASSARQVLEQVAMQNNHVLALFGNMDTPEVGAWLDEQDVGLHNAVRELDPQTAILGVGGSTFTPFSTPSEFPETRFAEWLDGLWTHARQYSRVVLVSHTPPRDTLCDLVEGHLHVGSQAVREFIMDCQPDVCLCGHVHESRAEDRLGRTVVVNPGSLSLGGYAVLCLGEQLKVSRHTL